LITVDVDGFALIINYQKQVVIAHFNFRDHVTALTFTPDSKFFAVATGKKLKIFESPDVTHKTFSPLVLYKKYANLHSDDITGISWSTDSRLFLTYSDDLTVKMMSLHKIKDFLPFTFSGNNRKIVSAFFSQDNSRIFTVSQNGVVLLWQWTDERGEGAQKQMEFAQFKSQKRLKVGGKPNEYVQSETDVSLMTELERKITSGRFLLEKKHRFTLQAQSRITSVDQVNQGDNKLLCVG
jgi:WD40 repeat protein